MYQMLALYVSIETLIKNGRILRTVPYYGQVIFRMSSKLRTCCFCGISFHTTYFTKELSGWNGNSLHRRCFSFDIPFNAVPFQIEVREDLHEEAKQNGGYFKFQISQLVHVNTT